jgi:hypothetical protein
MTNKCALCEPAPLFLNGGRQKFLVTKFIDEKAFSFDAQEMSLDEVRDLVLTTTARDKYALPLLKLAKFGDKRTAKKCLRHNDNVEAITGVEVDYDGERVTFEDAVALIRAAGLFALVYTSRSHMAAAPRWRAVLPTSKDLPPPERARLVARVNGVLGGILARESFTLSQSYYFGKVGSNPDHRAIVIGGDFIDLRDDLDAGAIGKSGAVSNGSGGGGFTPPGDLVTDEALEKNIIDGTSYHPEMVSLSARYIMRGVGPEGVGGELRRLMETRPADVRDDRWRDNYNDIPRIVASGVGYAERKRAEAEGPPPVTEAETPPPVTETETPPPVTEAAEPTSAAAGEMSEYDRFILPYCEDVELAPSTPKPKPVAKPAPPHVETPAADDENDYYVSMVGQLATKVWGSKHRRMTMTGEWRFGTKTVNNKTGRWYDFENNTHGDFDDLVALAAGGAAAPTITATPHDFPAERSIPPRDFLYGRHILRGTTSCTAAVGGSGKSAKSIVEALAMATGKPLLGVAPREALRVLLINLEDDRNEMNRRIAAAMRHYGLTPADVGDRLTVIARGELTLKIAVQEHTGKVKPDAAAIKMLTDYVITNRFDVVSIDPLRKTHSVNENDNGAMGDMLECYEEITEAADCAIHLWHHNRKSGGGETTVESLRGASALVDSFRSVEIMETMTREVAKQFGIEERRRKIFFRSFSGKLNFAPPIDESDWFEIQSIDLDNGFDTATTSGS